MAAKKNKLNRKALQRRRRRLSTGERLESKQMMAADASISYDAATDTINIIGSDYADEVVVTHNAHGAGALDDTIDVTVTYDKFPAFPWGTTVKNFSQNLNALKVNGGFPPSISIEQIVNKIHFEGGDGNDEFTNDTDIPSDAYGNAGNDVLRGGSANDLLDGGTGDDSLYGRAGNDWMKGYSGNDFLSGGSGNDSMYGRSGLDRMFGGSGNDYLSGGGDADEMHGGSGNDTLSGDGGNDDLYGDDGVDNLDGGIGEDRLDGGQDGDDDTLTGGPGVYTDMFFKEDDLVFDGLLLKNVNQENFTDFNMFNDIDVPDALVPAFAKVYTLPSEIGDVNANGTTDLTDFNRLKDNFGTAGERNDGDLDGDGWVGLTDFNILKAHFGESADYDFEKLIITIPPVLTGPLEPIDPLPPVLPPVIGPIDPIDPIDPPGPIDPNFAIPEVDPEEVLIGLLLPAVQKVREGDSPDPVGGLTTDLDPTAGLLLPAVQKVREAAAR